MTVQSKIEREMYRYKSAYSAHCTEAASQTICVAYKVLQPVKLVTRKALICLPIEAKSIEANSMFG